MLGGVVNFGVKNEPPPNLLTVHHVDSSEWNPLPWNLAALCQNVLSTFSLTRTAQNLAWSVCVLDPRL
jgi:hypothetical protein